MSRVKGDIAIKNYSYKKKNGTSFVLSEFIIFDLWILYKVRDTFKFAYRTFCSLFRTFYLMGLGAGILFICMFIHNNSHYFTCGAKDDYENLKKQSIEILVISNHSKADTALLREEIMKLRTKTWSLDMMIQKMNAELKNVNSFPKTTQLQLPDFVSEAVGGSVISILDTEPFHEAKGTQLSLFGIPIWRPNYFTPRKIIQPWTQAGECWAFRGSHGKILLQLALPATINHVTMEHIPVTMSLTGKIDSAPKKFTIFGYFREKYIKIDTFEYDIYGPSSQTFPVTKQDFLNVPFKRVMLEISSNWGNKEYTCIYRFRVHGKSHD